MVNFKALDIRFRFQEYAQIKICPLLKQNFITQLCTVHCCAWYLWKYDFILSPVMYISQRVNPKLIANFDGAGHKLINIPSTPSFLFLEGFTCTVYM